ncbi:unnamed protein product [Linum tenue]|uniref:Uncharacterized protein n=1 Tax=Linum tenue TaxID=586396 RepID=A0AAV0IJA3_9ROSI|nr:unnamed protein product [Linum tenue]
MNKFLEFGRKALFYAKVLSGYEERRIRNYRLMLEKRLQQAEEKKLALRKLPEQTILTEVRAMVEDMQALNKKLEETVSIEAAIDDYFKPINTQAEILMKQQLEGEEQTMTEMMKVLETKAMIEEAQAHKPSSKVDQISPSETHSQETESPTKQEAQMRETYKI